MSDRGAVPRAAILPLLLFCFVSAASPQGGSVSGPIHAFDPFRPGPGREPFPAVSPGIPDTLPVSGPDSVNPSITGETVDPPRGKKSSLTAVGLSALLPGAGQVYTENYWKVPIILGLGGYWVYEWTQNNDRYREFRDLYNGSIASTPPNGDERYLTLREFYRDQRDSFAWYIGILYFLNVVDAYVGAELYDFDVGPDLGSGGGGMQATLRIHL